MTSRAAYATLALLFAINTLNFFDRQILPAVQESLLAEEKQWGLSDSDLGWLGTAFILLYAVAGLPLGRLADVWHRQRLLAGGLGLWSLFTLGSGLAWNFWSLFAMRLGVGIGEASCAPAASSLIGDLFPPQKRALALAVFMIGLPVGLALSFIVNGMVAKEVGWRYAFFVAGAPGLVLAVVMAFLPETTRSTPQAGVAQGSFRESVRQILSLPTMWWVILSGALHNFNMYALGTFISSFLQRYHRLPIDEAGWASGLVYGMGGIGLFVSGWLGDRLHARGSRWRLNIAWTAAGLASPCLLAALLVPQGRPWVCTLCLVPAHFLLYCYYGVVYAGIQDMMPRRLHGLAMAVYFCLMYVGAVWGPVATGKLSHYLATEQARLEGALTVTPAHRMHGLHEAFFIVPMICFLLAVNLWIASRSIERDVGKLAG
jgi:MFS family permease